MGFEYIKLGFFYTTGVYKYLVYVEPNTAVYNSCFILLQVKFPNIP